MPRTGMVETSSAVTTQEQGVVSRMVRAVEYAKQCGYQPVALRLTEATWVAMRDELIAGYECEAVMSTPDKPAVPIAEPLPDQVASFLDLPVLMYTDVDRLTCSIGSLPIARLAR